jgi:RNA-binding protein Nova
VCLISGSVDGVLRIHEFIMEKIKEKPDPNAKIAIDFDHKQPAEREKQVKCFDKNIYFCYKSAALLFSMNDVTNQYH